MKRIRCGFTLIELIATLAILGLLLSLTVSAVQVVRGASARIQCANNMRQVALASLNYESRAGHFPPMLMQTPRQKGQQWPVWQQWPVTILPDLEQNASYQQFQTASRTSPPYQNPPHTGLTQVIPQYVCPADSRLRSPLTDEDGYSAAYCSYASVTGNYRSVNGVSIFQPGVVVTYGMNGLQSGTRPSDITDGLSNTVMYGESPPFGKWLRASWYVGYLPFKELWTTRPGRMFNAITVNERNTTLCRGPFQFSPGVIDNPCDSLHYWSLHNGGANFAFADGSVRTLSYSAAGVLPALATRAGGEVIPGDY